MMAAPAAALQSPALAVSGVGLTYSTSSGPVTSATYAWAAA